jgi:hypothetical protein
VFFLSVKETMFYTHMKKADKVTVLYLLIFMFLDMRPNNRSF